MTSRRLFLVFVLVGLGGLALALATTRPFERRQAESAVTMRTVGTSGAGPVVRRVPAGGTAFVLVARDGQQHFLTLTKPA